MWLMGPALGFPALLPTEMQKPTQCRWRISLIQTEVQATDALGTEGRGDLSISPTATTPMTNFSHWAYWTESKETCSFQALGTQWYLKVGRKIKISIFRQRVLIAKEAVVKRNEQEKWGMLSVPERFTMGRASSVLCLSKEHILINLSPSQWQKPSQAHYLHIQSWVRMAPVPLFLILFCGKFNAEMINCRADLVLFPLVIRWNQNAKFKLWNYVKV